MVGDVDTIGTRGAGLGFDVQTGEDTNSFLKSLGYLVGLVGQEASGDIESTANSTRCTTSGKTRELFDSFLFGKTKDVGVFIGNSHGAIVLIWLFAKSIETLHK